MLISGGRTRVMSWICEIGDAGVASGRTFVRSFGRGRVCDAGIEGGRDGETGICGGREGVIAVGPVAGAVGAEGRTEETGRALGISGNPSGREGEGGRTTVRSDFFDIGSYAFVTSSSDPGRWRVPLSESNR